jgi:hypothetical protein
MIKFAGWLKPGDVIDSGTVVATQKTFDGKHVQLTLSGRSDNIVLSKYTFLRTRRK